MQKYHMTAPGDTVILGVSGGADSVCLLLVLSELREELGIRLEAVHVHHGLRAEADAEEQYVRRLCERLSVGCTLVREDVAAIARQEKLSCEEAGRLVRYRAFRKKAGEYEEASGAFGDRAGIGAQEDYGTHVKIAVAHHKNDRAETVIFHLLRGSGMTGLAGIRPVRGKIIRPLLAVSREEIEAYLKIRNISWCMDGSNEEDVYTRNKIRHHLLPYAEKEICRGSVEHIVKAAEAVEEAEDFLEEYTNRAFEGCLTSADAEARERETDAVRVLSIKKLLSEHPVIQKRILLQALRQTGDAGKDIGSVHLEGLEKLILTQGSKQLMLPHGIIVKKEYDRLSFGKRRQSCSGERSRFAGQEASDIGRKAPIPGNVDLGDGRILYFECFPRQKSQIIPEISCTKWFDYDKIEKSVVVRTRRTGDYLTVDSSMSRQTVKKYMIQEKIPKERRGQLHMLADGAHILWVIGYRISQYYKVDERTETILQVRLEERDKEHG